MTLKEIEEFANKLTIASIDLPSDAIFLCSNFEKEVPKNMQSHILINYAGVSVMSETVYNTYLKENAKL